MSSLVEPVSSHERLGRSERMDTPRGYSKVHRDLCQSGDVYRGQQIIPLSSEYAFGSLIGFI